MKKIISGILALSMISGMSGFQNVCAVESDSEITISGSTMPTGVLEEGSIDCPNCGTELEFDDDDLTIEDFENDIEE